MSKKIAYIGIGTNIGDKKNNIIKALGELSKFNIIKKISKLYKSKAWGYKEQDDFFNIAIKIETDFNPFELLNNLKKIEEAIGREKSFRWGPRIIDLDILLYENRVISTVKLTVPHKEMINRLFVLIPLKDIDKDISIYGKRLDYYIDKLDSKDIELERIEDWNF